jgi:Flp pilus assembly protein TadG
MMLSRIVNGLKRTCARFARAERGNVAMIFALLLPVLISSIGAAIDYSRAVNARSSMQAAADATALMISKEATSLTAAQITSKATAYFNALFNHPEIGSVTFSAAYSANSGNGASVTVTAGGSMPTDFMKLAGMANLPISVSSQTKWGNMRYRVALALDNTGSMDDADKMNQLQLATKQLINDFYAMAGANEDIYISIVPFAKDVNIGSSFKNATWLRWTGAGNSTDDSFTNRAGTCSSGGWWGSPSYYNKADCVANGRTWTATSKNSWNGCVMDRDQDYDTTNDVPSSSVQGTMVWPEQYGACPAQMLGMTSVKQSKQTLIDKVDDMSPNGATNQGIGLFWAWMTHQTAGPFPSPSKNSNYTYIDAIILLTDGLNTQNRFYGNGYSQSPEIDARQTTLCTNVRATGVKIFAVQVATNGDAQSDMLKNCTSDPSNPNYFSYITQASQMTVKFQNIFKELSRLRVAS